MHARLGVTLVGGADQEDVRGVLQATDGLSSCLFTGNAPALVVADGKHAVQLVLKWAQRASLAKYRLDSNPDTSSDFKKTPQEHETFEHLI